MIRSPRRLLLAGLLALAVPATQADYADHPKVPALMAALRDDYGFSATDLDGVRRALDDAKRVPKLIQSEVSNKEKTLAPDWGQYRALHITERNVDNGLRFLDEHRAWFAKAETEFGVAPTVVAAVMGVETKYGSYTGKYRVLDSLATQGFDHPTRSAFFFSELLEFFAVCRDAGRAPGEWLGSYAGAMGDAQFMPSNYRRLALDFDGDGRRDLWSPADAIGSIAHYLSRYDASRAFRRGEPLTVPAQLEQPLAEAVPRNGRRVDSTVGALRRLGVVPLAALPDDEPAGLIELRRGEAREYWIGLPNFFAVQTYNPRVFYAMAVTQLAGALAEAQRSGDVAAAAADKPR